MTSQCRALWPPGGACAIALFGAGILGLLGFAAPGAASALPSPVHHIVVIYLENHSFDNVLGYWCETHRGRCPDGSMPSRVTLSNGTIVTPAVMPDTVPSVKHNVVSQLVAMNGGRMNGWQNIPGGGCSALHHHRCIGGYEPRQIPNLSALATRFAISDRTFSMADSPSWGGHLYAVTGSLDGFLGNNPQPTPG